MSHLKLLSFITLFVKSHSCIFMRNFPCFGSFVFSCFEELQHCKTCSCSRNALLLSIHVKIFPSASSCQNSPGWEERFGSDAFLIHKVGQGVVLFCFIFSFLFVLIFCRPNFWNGCGVFVKVKWNLKSNMKLSCL